MMKIKNTIFLNQFWYKEVKMKKNIGTIDRLVRLAIAIILLCLAYWFASWLLLAFSLFTFYETLAGWCIFYQIIGKNSCAIKSRFKQD